MNSKCKEFSNTMLFSLIIVLFIYLSQRFIDSDDSESELEDSAQLFGTIQTEQDVF